MPEEFIATGDFETVSLSNLRTVGAFKYSEHWSTEALCFAYCLSPGEIFIWTLDPYLHVEQKIFKLVKDEVFEEYTVELYSENEPPRELFEYLAAGGLMEAHNSFFEWCVWNNVCVPKYGWPRLSIGNLRCSMAKCRASSIPGALGTAGKILDLPVQKDAYGEELLKILSIPKTWKITGKTNLFKPFTDQHVTDLHIYCGRDVESEICLSEALPKMNPVEVEIWKLDQIINRRGVYVDIPTIRNIMKVMEGAKAHYQAKLVEISKGAFKTAGQRDKILAWVERQGYKMKAFTKQDVKAALEDRALPRDVRKVLKIRQILGKTSTAKYKKIIEKVASDGRVHETLVYHKAHTGRWGGAGVQVQNLPRPTVKAEPEKMVALLNTGDYREVEKEYKNVFELASSAIRSVITAPPGKTLISADFAAIEARVLFWMAGDESALDIFRRDDCIYCEMASEIYDEPPEVIYKGYKAGDFDYSNKRKMGKDAVLGLGYQMGWEKFIKMVHGFSGKKLDDDFAKYVVRTYRDKFYLVPELWSGIEHSAVSALENPGSVFSHGKLQYCYKGYYLMCKLPSGRIIRYPGAKLDYTTTSWGAKKLSVFYKTMKDNRWEWTSTYGGKMTENGDQAIARDLLGHSMLKIEKAKYPLIMCVHDENVSEIPEKYEISPPPAGAYGTVEHYCATMVDSPRWAEGLPLKAAGWIGKRYRK